jgi:hypothetical protein
MGLFADIGSWFGRRHKVTGTIAGAVGGAATGAVTGAVAGLLAAPAVVFLGTSVPVALAVSMFFGGGKEAAVFGAIVGGICGLVALAFAAPALAPLMVGGAAFGAVAGTISGTVVGAGLGFKESGKYDRTPKAKKVKAAKDEASLDEELDRAFAEDSKLTHSHSKSKIKTRHMDEDPKEREEKRAKTSNRYEQRRGAASLTEPLLDREEHDSRRRSRAVAVESPDSSDHEATVRREKKVEYSASRTAAHDTTRKEKKNVAGTAGSLSMSRDSYNRKGAKGLVKGLTYDQCEQKLQAAKTKYEESYGEAPPIPTIGNVPDEQTRRNWIKAIQEVYGLKSEEDMAIAESAVILSPSAVTARTGARRMPAFERSDSDSDLDSRTELKTAVSDDSDDELENVEPAAPKSRTARGKI